MQFHSCHCKQSLRINVTDITVINTCTQPDVKNVGPQSPMPGMHPTGMATYCEFKLHLMLPPCNTQPVLKVFMRCRWVPYMQDLIFM